MEFKDPGQHYCKIFSIDRLNHELFLLTVLAPLEKLQHFHPGQFAQILLPEAEAHLLRRPMSIADFDSSNGTVSFLIRRVGAGTNKLYYIRAGTRLDILMPLGHGFTPPKPEEKIWLVGGGTGVAPLMCMRTHAPRNPMRAYFGFTDVYHAYPKESAKDAVLVTEDGSLGEKGMVTDIVAKALKSERPDRIVACGPPEMYRALSKIVGDIPTEISLEERMGCGTGGCETCVAAVNGNYVKTCTDGPVFNLREVDEFNG